MIPRWSHRYAAYSEEEDWDIGALKLINCHLEKYIRMLPGGAGDLTLAELQEMASRQQQQMESQQQVLVAKEQRLKYLKQQEARHASLASENERLRRIRERVESQELKLKKLRALRGQAEQYRTNNGHLNSELDAVRTVFNEKEKELALAVARVDQLNRQLKELRNGASNGLTGNKQAVAAAELDKLRKELLIRNKLNEQQSNTIATKEKLLNQRQEEVSRMDMRIQELQQRLKKRRYQEQQANLQNQTGKQTGTTDSKLSEGKKSNTANRDPYIQYAPPDVPKDDSYSKSGTFDKQDPKYQTLPSNVKFVPPSSRKAEELQSGRSKQQELNNNVEIIEEYKLPTVLPADNNNHRDFAKLGHHQHYPAPVQGKNNNNEPLRPAPSVSHQNQNQHTDRTAHPPVSKGGVAATSQVSSGQGSKFTPIPGSNAPRQRQYPSAGEVGSPAVGFPSDGGGGKDSHSRQAPLLPSSSHYPIINITDEERQAGSGQSSPASSEGSSNSSGGIQVMGEDQTEVNTESIGSVSAMIEKLNKNNGHKPNQAPPPPTSVASSTSNQFRPHSVQLQRSRVASQDSNMTMSEKLRGISSSSVPSASSLFSGRGASNANNNQQSSAPGQEVGLPSPLPPDEVDSSRLGLDSPHVPAPATSTPLPQTGGGGTHPHLNQKPVPTYRYASKNQIANTYMGRLGGAAMEKYQRSLNQLYKNLDSQEKAQAAERNKQEREKLSGKEADKGGDSEQPVQQENTQFGVAAPHDYPDIASDKGSYKLNTPKHIRRRHSDSENEELNKALQEQEERQQQQQQQQQEKPADSSEITHAKTATNRAESSSSAMLDKPISQPPQDKDKTVPTKPPAPAQTSSAKSSDTPLAAKASQSGADSKQNGTAKSTADGSSTVVRRTKSNLKKENVRRSNNRVSFDPLALLLDASLEGELDLVKKVAVQVDDVSTPNDEGITALHNAICAGHYDIVKCLVEFGCDVNSPDSDGWTPLHCAASCNNLPMVRFLVEHGACVFATTISDHETAADKCEEEEDGYDGCSDYLYSIQEKLGITNNGEVYAVFDYQATNTDELSFTIGAKLMVLRKGDETEKEWWWAKLNGKEGYIPRNLLGLYPRVIQHPREVSDC